MGDRDWLRLYRKLRHHWVWQQKPFSPGQAWADLMMRANWKPTKIPRPGGTGHATLGRGEIIVSHRRLADDWGWSRNRVLRFLKALSDDTMIETTNETTFTRIKIVNFKALQAPKKKRGTTHGAANGPSTEPPTDQGRTTHGTTDGTHHKKEKNVKNWKKGEEYPSAHGGHRGNGTGKSVDEERHRLVMLAEADRLEKIGNHEKAAEIRKEFL